MQNLVAESAPQMSFVNKTYVAHLEFSFYLYRTFELFVRPVVPFYMIIPEDEVSIFEDFFKRAIDARNIRQLPIFLIEQELLDRTKIVVKKPFNGWMSQQLSKLGFGLTGISENYFCIDSDVMFFRHFNWQDSLFDSNGKIKTPARPFQRDQRRLELLNAQETGWKDGKLGLIADSFDYISEFCGSKTESTYHFISATAIMSSLVIKCLKKYIQSKGLDDFSDLIYMAPYECAWYGDFVFQQNPIEFIATDPDFARICTTEAQLVDFEAGRERVFSAICFQPSVRNLITPERAFHIIENVYGRESPS